MFRSVFGKTNAGTDVVTPGAFARPIAYSQAGTGKFDIRGTSVVACGMPFIVPAYTEAEVNAAGRVMATADMNHADRGQALDVLSNWRSSHAYPLLAVRMTLRKRSEKIDSSVLIAQRLKRLTSIQGKLERFGHLRLAGIQDIGGCRAIVKGVGEIAAIDARYAEADRRHTRNDRPELVKRNDYVVEPKADGYRSLHLIYRYRTASEKLQVYSGLKIEIQIRTRLQHCWATAVETASTILGQDFKAGRGDPRWRRFFALAGTAFAMYEDSPLVPDTPRKPGDLKAELIRLWEEKNVEALLQDCSMVLDSPPQAPKLAKAYLLRVNVKEQRIYVTSFLKGELEQASELYLDTEKAFEGAPEVQVVLVGTDSWTKLKRAFPNYYADTRDFVAALKGMMA